MRPLLLPTGNSPHVARRIIGGDHAEPPPRAEDVLPRVANDDVTGLGVGLMILSPLVGAVACLVVIGFLLGRSA